MEAGPPSMRRWWLIGLGLTAAWVAFLAFFGPETGAGGLEVPSLEPPARPAITGYDWPVRDLDDRPADFAQFRGRPVLLNLWATWCGPCVEEMPALARLAADPRIKAAGAVVVCVSTDESPDALRRFVKDKPWAMTILRATSLPPEFATDGIPATFLIAPDGRIAAAQVGSAKWDDPSVAAFLEKLASPKP